MEKKEKNWKSVTSWKNWLLPGAISGVVFLLVFNLIYLLIIFKGFFYGGGRILSSLFELVFITLQSTHFGHMFRYLLLGILVAGSLKYIFSKLKGKLRLLITFAVFVLVIILIFWDLKPISLYSCSSEGYAPFICLEELAVNKRDSDICYYLFEFDKRACIIEVVTAKAIHKDDERVCYSLENPREGRTYYEIAHCVTEFAKANKDESFCEQLEGWSGFVQEGCYKELAIVKDDISLCEKSSYQNSKSCYTTILENKSNPAELCSTLQTGLIFDCLNVVDCDKSKDITDCEKILESTKANYHVCELEGNDYIQRRCYTDFALYLNNVELCAKTGNKAPCYEKIAIATDNMNLCGAEGLDPVLMTKCYKHFAELKNDLSICYKVAPGENYVCMKDYAVRQDNPELCETLPSYKEACYADIAMNRQDTSLCEKAGEFKENCVKQILKT